IPITRPIDIGNGQTIDGVVTLFDLDVADYILPSQEQARLVVATGHNGLTVVNPTQESVMFQGILSGGQSMPGRLDNGFALALATISQTPIVAVIGRGSGIDPQTRAPVEGWVLGIADMTNPSVPRPISFMAVPGTATDVQINNNLAYLGVVQAD